MELKKIVARARELTKHNPSELDRCSWMAVHEHQHGFMPSEYDIREVDENLYLQVLNELKGQIN